MESTVAAVFGVDPFRIGGVEVYTRELARQLELRGTKLVAIFSRLPKGNVAEYLRAPNLELAAIPELETSMQACIRPLAGLLRRHQPKVLHMQFVNFVGAFPWVAKMCGVEQIFFTAQGSNPGDYVAHRAPAWKRLAVRVINAPVTRVFAISDYTRRSLVDLDVLPKERFQVIYNAILPPCLDHAAEAGARFRRRFEIPEGRKLVTQVSWIIPEKGVPQLLDAAQRVLRECPEAHFAFVGNGAQQAEYRQKAEGLGIAASVIWTGLMENPMEDGVYAATDIFCLASQWQEAFGWVLAEAMAFEKPAVATAVGGIPEVVEDGVTGLLVRPANDSAVLAQQLLRLLQNPDLSRQMGLAGRQQVEKKFHLERNVAQLLTHYSL